MMKCLTSYHLKIIALISMMTDHLGVVFFPDIPWFRMIGRMAFVLYAFMLVEGTNYTSNLSKYKKKLFVWALLSEVPYDLVFYDSYFSLDSQNIFFTLLIGVVGIELFNQNIFKNILIASLGIFLGYVLKVDYSWYGIALIYGFYFFRKSLFLNLSFAQLLSVFYSINIFPIQFFAFLGFIPIILYNGKLGKKIGDIYYAFYAVHLIVFYTLRGF